MIKISNLFLKFQILIWQFLLHYGALFLNSFTVISSVKKDLFYVKKKFRFCSHKQIYELETLKNKTINIKNYFSVHSSFIRNLTLLCTIFHGDFLFGLGSGLPKTVICILYIHILVKLLINSIPFFYLVILAFHRSFGQEN